MHADIISHVDTFLIARVWTGKWKRINNVSPHAPNHNTGLTCSRATDPRSKFVCEWDMQFLTAFVKLMNSKFRRDRLLFTQVVCEKLKGVNPTPSHLVRG